MSRSPWAALGCLIVGLTAALTGSALVALIRWALDLHTAAFGATVEIVALLAVSALLLALLLETDRRVPTTPDLTRGRRPADALPRGNQAPPARPPRVGVAHPSNCPPLVGGRALSANGMGRTSRGVH